MSVIPYTLSIIANYIIASRHYKGLSRLEKSGIASSIALGVDAVIVPAFSDGRTLHQIVTESIGMSIPETIEYGVKLGESLLAWAGQVYYAGRNLRLCWQKKVKE